jgi:regulator of nonsense transcripts 1
MKEFEFKWPVPAHPMVFYHSISSEEISSSGTSFLNRIEAKNVEEVVTTFLRGGLNPD